MGAGEKRKEGEKRRNEKIFSGLAPCVKLWLI